MRAAGIPDQLILDAIELQQQEDKAALRARVAKYRINKEKCNEKSVTAVTPKPKPLKIKEKCNADHVTAVTSVTADAKSLITNEMCNEKSVTGPTGQNKRKVPPTPPSKENREGIHQLTTSQDSPPPSLSLDRDLFNKPAPARVASPVPDANGTRLRDDWTPSPADIATAAEHGIIGLRLQREAVKFRNYWTARTGRDSTKRNWNRTFENWCIKAAEEGERGNGRGPPGAFAYRDEIDRVFDDLMQKAEKEDEGKRRWEPR
jgi:hypothetical protein